jgi:hypothetical protein
MPGGKGLTYKAGCHVYLDVQMATKYFVKAYTGPEMTDVYFLIPVYFLKKDIVVTGGQDHKEKRTKFNIPTAVVKKYYIQPEVFQQMMEERKTTNMCKPKKA